MATNTTIEWTATVQPDGSVTKGSTWNPVRGCTKVSPGCAHCYAETFAERFRGVKGHPYEQGFDLRLVPEKLAEPLKWKQPRRVFVNSMSDLFHDTVPNEYIAAVFGVMAACQQHTFQVLTKRAARLPQFFAWLAEHEGGARLEVVWQALMAEKELIGDGGPMHTKHCADPHGPWPLPNVWLGVSVENQHFADERIPLLLDTPAAVRFLSLEPLLEKVDLTKFLWTIPGARRNGLHWLIVGGESGNKARPFDISWARWLVAQGKSADVAVFVKQLGAAAGEWEEQVTGNAHGEVDDESAWHPLPTKSRKGGDPNEWPADLRVREFPRVSA